MDRSSRAWARSAVAAARASSVSFISLRVDSYTRPCFGSYDHRKALNRSGVIARSSRLLAGGGVRPTVLSLMTDSLNASPSSARPQLPPPVTLRADGLGDAFQCVDADVHNSHRSRLSSAASGPLAACSRGWGWSVRPVSTAVAHPKRTGASHLIKLVPHGFVACLDRREWAILVMWAGMLVELPQNGHSRISARNSSVLFSRLRYACKMSSLAGQSSDSAGHRAISSSASWKVQQAMDS